MIVVGSGAAGLAAALAGAVAGAPVRLYEKAPKLGGTTALSGGVAWFPGNHLAEDDSPEAAGRYLTALGLGDVDPALIDVFLDEAPDAARRIEEHSSLRWQEVPYPDYHAELPGGRLRGRSLEPEPLFIAPDTAEMVRTSPNIIAPVTYREVTEGAVSRDEVARRRHEGVVTLGPALVAGLLAAALDAGVKVRAATPVRGLVTERGAVQGVLLDEGMDRGPVVLATGGFERDPELVRTFLRGPMMAPVGVGETAGDGLRMALQAGARLGNMGEAWWCPAMRVPGEEIDGAPMFRILLSERARPGCVIVDRSGERFADEAQNYNDFGRALHAFDPGTYRYPRIPAWLVFDSACRRRYHLGPLRRGDPDPDWLIRAADVKSLADRIDVPAPVLADTLDRFNKMALTGNDEDFGRGQRAYDRFVGDGDAPHPNLGPVSEPPFYAVEVLPGCLGTKGGPRTDGDGRVLAAGDDMPLPGLFVAGNAAASPFGLAYPGAGGTIGPALVFGWRAGVAASKEETG